MKALIISDTHGDLRNARKVLEAFEGEVSAVFHSGDYFSDAEELEMYYPEYDFFAVSGNCDWNSAETSTKQINFGGKNIFLSHGHPYGVKYGVSKIYYAALERNADICIFGHTHKMFLNVSDDLILINPGSISLPRDNYPSFAVLDTDENVKCDFYYVKNGNITLVDNFEV